MCNIIRLETLAQVFSSEFCQISLNIFFTEHLWTTASGSMEYFLLLLWTYSKVTTWAGSRKLKIKQDPSVTMKALNLNATNLFNALIVAN